MAPATNAANASATATLLRAIVVPLDGSELSERITGQLGRILGARDATVTLLGVASAPGEPEDATRLYLERVASRLRSAGATVEGLTITHLWPRVKTA